MKRRRLLGLTAATASTAGCVVGYHDAGAAESDADPIPGVDLPVPRDEIETPAPRDQIPAIVDPAFGGWSEAKTTGDDRETLDRLREFRGYGRPILVSINRKNFLREIAGRSTDEALSVSLAATSMAVE